MNWFKTYFWGLLLVGLLLWGGCRKPPEGESAAEVFSYNPAEDLLVNPASLTEPPPDDLSLIETDDTLTIQLDANPNTLHPFYVSTISEFLVINAIYTGLFTYNKDIRWQVHEDMVQSYRESPDHREYIVTLKDGLTWQDGAPLTAQDVVYSWEQILNDKVPCFSQKPSTEPIAECVALDDTTVKLVQPEPAAMARWHLLFPVLPKHLFDKDQENHPDLKSGEYYRGLSRQPVGNGPYRLTEWKDQDRIVLERWADYPGVKPYFKRIVFRIVPDKNMALLLFQKGELDVIEGLSPQQFAREATGESVGEKGVKGWSIGGNKQRFEFTLLMPQNASGGEPIGAIFQEELKPLGVRMNIHALEWTVYLEKLRSHEFEAFLGSWNPGLDPDWQWSIWRTEGYQNGRNYIGYSSRQVDRLFESARREFDVATRQELYRQIHQQTYIDQPYAWICHSPNLTLFHRRIQGVQFSPRGIFGFYPSHLQWWAAKKKLN